MHWPPSPEEYRQMLERRRILMAELLVLELEALEQRKRDLEANPTKRYAQPRQAKAFLEEIARLEALDRNHPEIPALRLKAAAADAYGWSHRTVQKSARKRTGS